MKKQVDLSHIESLSFGLRAPIYESLRILKLNFPAILYDVLTIFNFSLNYTYKFLNKTYIFSFQITTENGF